MSSASANTSGAEVTSLGQLPKDMYGPLLDYLKGLVAQLQPVVDGEADMIAADFMEKSGTDCIGNERMSEICRRLVLTLSKGIEGNIIFSATEPDDHTKAWQPIDPLTKIPTGQYKVWDSEEGENGAWVVPDTSGDATPYVPPLEFFGRVVAPPGASTQSLSFPDMKTTNYFVHVTPTSLNAGAYLPFPATFANNFGVVNKANSQVTLQFSSIPNLGTTPSPIGVTFEVWIRVNPTP